MTGWPLFIATGCYILTAFDLLQTNPPMALAFGAYAVANFGLIWAAYY